MKNNLVIVTGISGSGKDYLLEKAQGIDSQINTIIPIFSAGEEMMKKIKRHPELKNIQNRDELKTKLTTEISKEIVQDILNDILVNQPAILNGHVAYKQNGSIQINPDIEKIINARDYILITTNPELLLERRTQDTSRNRESEELIDVTIHQDIAKAATQVLAKHLGARFTLLDNAVNNVRENAEKIIEIIHN